MQSWTGRSALENFHDKDVLELGCGWECNLVRLATVAGNVIGLEIEQVYVAFSRILTKRERISAPQIVLGAAENIPFRADVFDWILLWSALRYMEIGEALRECSRVLRPGGRALLSFVRSICRLLSRKASFGLRAPNCCYILSTR